MTENRWDEIWKKPAFNFLSYHPDELLRVSGKISVNEEWLKEVKAEGDALQDKVEAVNTHLESYPDEKSDEYLIERHYPSTAGSHVFNSVMFLTHLETWHKQLKKILGAEG